MIGCSTLTRLGDVYGRKPIYMLGIVMHLIFMAGILFVTKPVITYLLIFWFGLSISTRYYVGYTYNVEMQPKSHYVLVSTTQFVFESITYTFVCIYFWKISRDWKLLQIPNVTLMVIGFVFLAMMPESPRFLISIRKFKEAREIFAWIGKVNGLDQNEINRRLSEIYFDGENPGLGERLSTARSRYESSMRMDTERGISPEKNALLEIQKVNSEVDGIIKRHAIELDIAFKLD